MEIQKKVSSALIYFIATGLLLTFLWGLIFLNRQIGYFPASPGKEKASLSLTLPNILAPLIRNRVHKDWEKKQEPLMEGVNLSELLRILIVR